MDVVDLNLSKTTSVEDLLKSYSTTGFQATELAQARGVLERMYADENCFKFLSFTANMVASGLRGVFAQLIADGRVDAVITTGGSIDHDIIKCFNPYQIGSFHEDDIKLHKKGVNRLGNILVSNDHYILLEKKVQPVFKKVFEKNERVSPKELIHELSFLCNKEDSFLYQARKKNIPVFSPALIDSAIGLQLHFFKQDHSKIALDETGDMRELSTLVSSAKKTGALILGGGVSKHFTLGLNLMRGGLDYSVYVSTAQEFDGSLSGARPKEAKSWGKIKEKTNAVLVNADASIALPLLIAGL